jgi:hypothetical protein
VAGDEALVNSGPFKYLDAEVRSPLARVSTWPPPHLHTLTRARALRTQLHLRIFGSLDFTERLLCVSEVCKGWRALRREPSLWRSLALCAPAFSGAGAVAFVCSPRSPLASPAAVERLELHGGSAFDAKAFKAVLKQLSHARDVALSGKKLSPDTLALLAKPGRGAPLERLSVGKCSGATSTLLGVLRASPALRELACDISLDAAWLNAAAARTAATRDGGASLLTRLAVGARVGAMDAGLHVGAFARMSLAFPELSSLAIQTLKGAETAGLGAPVWAPMPALRELRIEAMGTAYSAKLTRSAQLQELLGRIAAAAPRLTLLHVSRGCEWLSQADVKAGRVFTPLPAVGAGMSGIASLAALEELKLSYVAVSAADVAAADLPSLQRLELRACGAHAAAAAAALARGAPKLRALSLAGVPCTELDGTPGPGASGLAALASASLRELALRAGFDGDAAPLARSRSLPDSGAALAAQLLSLAARGALPALCALVVSTKHMERMPPAFDAAHPWPELRALSLLSMAPECVPAQLAALRAPKLAALSRRCRASQPASLWSAPRACRWRRSSPTRTRSCARTVTRRCSRRCAPWSPRAPPPPSAKWRRRRCREGRRGWRGRRRAKRRQRLSCGWESGGRA